MPGKKGQKRIVKTGSIGFDNFRKTWIIYVDNTLKNTIGLNVTDISEATEYVESFNEHKFWGIYYVEDTKVWKFMIIDTEGNLLKNFEETFQTKEEAALARDIEQESMIPKNVLRISFHRNFPRNKTTSSKKLTENGHNESSSSSSFASGVVINNNNNNNNNKIKSSVNTTSQANIATDVGDVVVTYKKARLIEPQTNNAKKNASTSCSPGEIIIPEAYYFLGYSKFVINNLRELLALLRRLYSLETDEFYHVIEEIIETLQKSIFAVSLQRIFASRSYSLVFVRYVLLLRFEILVIVSQIGQRVILSSTFYVASSTSNRSNTNSENEQKSRKILSNFYNTLINTSSSKDSKKSDSKTNKFKKMLQEWYQTIISELHRQPLTDSILALKVELDTADNYVSKRRGEIISMFLRNLASIWNPNTVYKDLLIPNLNYPHLKNSGDFQLLVGEAQIIAALHSKININGELLNQIRNILIRSFQMDGTCHKERALMLLSDLQKLSYQQTFHSIDSAHWQSLSQITASQASQNEIMKNSLDQNEQDNYDAYNSDASFSSVDSEAIEEEEGFFKNNKQEEVSDDDADASSNDLKKANKKIKNKSKLRNKTSTTNSNFSIVAASDEYIKTNCLNPSCIRAVNNLLNHDDSHDLNVLKLRRKWLTLEIQSNINNQDYDVVESIKVLRKLGESYGELILICTENINALKECDFPSFLFHSGFQISQRALNLWKLTYYFFRRSSMISLNLIENDDDDDVHDDFEHSIHQIRMNCGKYWCWRFFNTRTVDSFHFKISDFNFKNYAESHIQAISATQAVAKWMGFEVYSKMVCDKMKIAVVDKCLNDIYKDIDANF